MVRALSAIGHEGEFSIAADAHAGRLLSGLQVVGHPGRLRFQVEDMNSVAGLHFAGARDRASGNSRSRPGTCRV